MTFRSLPDRLGAFQWKARPQNGLLSRAVARPYSTRLLCLCSNLARTEGGSRRVSLAAAELRSTVDFGRLPERDGFAIVVSRVAAQSQAEQRAVRVLSQEGLASGQKLLAVSSPMHSGSKGELWNVTDRPSLRFVIDAIRMNRSGTVTLEVTDRAITGDDDVISEDSGFTLLQSMEDQMLRDRQTQTVSQKLTAAHQANEEAKLRDTKQRERRIQRRMEYMSRESTRDNSKFFVGLAASLFLPAIGILLYAFSSGLLERIGSSYRPY